MVHCLRLTFAQFASGIGDNGFLEEVAATLDASLDEEPDEELDSWGGVLQTKSEKSQGGMCADISALYREEVPRTPFFFWNLQIRTSSPSMSCTEVRNSASLLRSLVAAPILLGWRKWSIPACRTSLTVA